MLYLVHDPNIFNIKGDKGDLMRSAVCAKIANNPVPSFTDFWVMMHIPATF